MGWEEELLEFSLDGLVLPLKERRIRGGTDFAGVKYQGVSGQDTEPTGLKERHFDIVTELFSDVDEAHYPGLYRDLHDLLMDVGKMGEVEYNDVVWGPIPVIIADWDIFEEAGKRDGATITLEIQERASDPVTFIDGAGMDPSGMASIHAVDLDAALGDIGISLEDIETGFDDIGYPLDVDDALSFPELFITLTDGFFDLLEEGAVAADELAWEVDRYRARVDKVMSFDPMREATNWGAFYSAVSLADTVTRAADIAGGNDSDQGPQFVEFTVPEVMSAQEISQMYYGTPAKAQAIIARNPVPNPLFYPEGKILTIEALTF